MKLSLSMKTLYRSPLKTFLTFILLAAVSFAIYSQTAEYVVTSRETDRASLQYIGVGAAEISPPEDIAGIIDTASPRYISSTRYEPLTMEQVDAIAMLPYITSVDKRYMTAGISDTYYRPDDGEYCYNYTARCVIAGTLAEVEYGEPIKDITNFQDSNFNRLILDDCELLAGTPPWAVDGETLTICADPTTHDENTPHTGIGGGSAERLLTIHDSSYTYGTEYIESLGLGERYAFVLRFEPLSIERFGATFEYREYYLSDHLAELWCGAVWPLVGTPDNYLETEEFAPLRELVEITDADARTFDMVYTEDMSAITRFAEGEMAIAEGRALTPEDSVSNSRVCVISREFADANDLPVGDARNFKLGTKLFAQLKGLGAVAVTKERYAPAETEITLEIVGIYTDVDSPVNQADNPNWNYSLSTVFVPKSLLPVNGSALTEHEFAPGEFSFKIENAWDIPEFLEEVAPVFEELGLSLIFDDGGWTEMSSGFLAARKLSLIKLAALMAATAAATVFVVYLFIGRRRKEYAVMRALGTPRGAAARSLLVPLLALAAVSILAGGAAARIYTAKTIANSNVLSALEGFAVDTSVPAPVSVCCITGELLLTLLFALALLRRIGAFPPLALLQDGGNGQRRAEPSENNKNHTGRRDGQARPLRAAVSQKRSEIRTASRRGRPCPSRRLGLTDNAIIGVAAAVNITNIPGSAAAIPPATRKSRSIGFILRYIWKHTRRSAAKSALALILAALLITAAGQFTLMEQSYAKLRDDTVVTANFAGGLPLSFVTPIIKSGYVKNPYYEAGVEADMNFAATRVVVTNDIARYTCEKAEITYAEGFDASCMDSFGEIMILGDALIEMRGIEPGDTVIIVPPMYLDQAKVKYEQYHMAKYPGDTLTVDKIEELYGEKIK